MFGCYRKGDANDPDTYVAAVTSVLARYDAEIVKAVTDPYNGLPARKKENGYSGLPDVADVKEACEAEAVRRARLADYASLPRPTVRRLSPPPKGPGAFATIFVHPDAPQYQAFMQRKETADPREWRYDETRPGILVSFAWFTGPADGVVGFKQFSADDLRAMYPPRGQADAPEREEAEIPF